MSHFSDIAQDRLRDAEDLAENDEQQLLFFCASAIVNALRGVEEAIRGANKTRPPDQP